MLTLEYQLQRFKDYDSLLHFMILYKESGICLFYHSFIGEEISYDLISGFISAMYGELSGDGTHSNIESLKYRGIEISSSKYATWDGTIECILQTEGQSYFEKILNDL